MIGIYWRFVRRQATEVGCCKTSKNTQKLSEPQQFRKASGRKTWKQTVMLAGASQ